MENYFKRIIEEVKKLAAKLTGIERYMFSSLAKQSKEVLSYIRKLKEESEALLEKYKNIKADDEEPLKADDKINLYNYQSLMCARNGAQCFHKTISNGMVVSLVSLFDYYLRTILKETCYYLGEKLNSKDLSVQFNEIKGCKTIDAVQEYYYEKYLESLFSGSHDRVFEEIKTRFNIDQIKKARHYKDLIFITELRNIIVHNDSKVSITFKNRMLDFGINYKDYEMIDEKKAIIKMTPANVLFIFDVLIYMAIHIAISFESHFNKRNEDISNQFFGEINELLLRYVSNKHAKIGVELFELLMQFSRNSSEKFLYTINKCVGLKTLGEMEEMQQVLDSLDWSNCDDRYKFAKNCLLDNYEESISFLEKQTNKEYWKYNLQTWPLCVGLTRAPLFLEKYQTIFGEAFVSKIKTWENTQDDLDIVEKQMKNRKHS